MVTPSGSPLLVARNVIYSTRTMPDLQPATEPVVLGGMPYQKLRSAAGSGWCSPPR
jgi:hypothetical protein